jgi:hypothetical protein
LAQVICFPRNPAVGGQGGDLLASSTARYRSSCETKLAIALGGPVLTFLLTTLQLQAKAAVPKAAARELEKALASGENPFAAVYEE